MRRDQFSVDVRGVEPQPESEDPRQPEVVIDCDGDVDGLVDRLTGLDGAPLAADETDVSLRLLGPVDEDPEGVVAVTNRLTGDFVLELNVEAADVFEFVAAARRYGERAGDDGRYRVTLRIDGEQYVAWEKTTLLVYNESGDLLRKESLIPGGVEL